MKDTLKVRFSPEKFSRSCDYSCGGGTHRPSSGGLSTPIAYPSTGNGSASVSQFFRNSYTYNQGVYGGTFKTYWPLAGAYTNPVFCEGLSAGLNCRSKAHDILANKGIRERGVLVVDCHYMEKLSFSLYLALAVLLGSAITSNSVSALDVLNAQYGGVTLKIPYPNNLCPIDRNKTEFEKMFFEWQEGMQKQANAKLMAMFIECDKIKKIRAGNFDFEKEPLEKWMMVTGGLTVKDQKERVFSSVSPEKFQKDWLKRMGVLDDPDLGDKLNTKVGKVVEDANAKYFGEENRKVLSLGQTTNLGVLAVTDSVHSGMLSVVTFQKEPPEKRVISFVMGTTLVKGVITHFYLYEYYESKDTIKSLLSKSKIYSAPLVNIN